MTFCSFSLFISLIMLGAASYEIMPGDEKIPSDEKLYPVIWEARNKGKLQSLFRDATFPLPKKAMSRRIKFDWHNKGEEILKLGELEQVRHRGELQKHHDHRIKLQANVRNYTCLGLNTINNRQQKLTERLNELGECGYTATYQKCGNTDVYIKYLDKVKRHEERMQRHLEVMGKHPENLKKCIDKLQKEETGSSLISTLFADYWSWRLKQSPEFATLTGNKDHNDVLEDFSEERYEEDFKACNKFKSTATELLKTAKDPDELLNLEILIAELSTFIEGYPLKGFYFPLTYLGGIHTEFQKLAQTPVSVKDLKDILARYKAFPSYVDQTVRMMTLAMQKKLTNHAVSMKGVLKSCKIHSSASPNQTAFYEPFKLADEITKDIIKGATLKNEAILSIKNWVQPAFSKLAELLEKKYLPACRKDIAVTSLPNIGAQFYKACLKYHTSTDLTAEEIHKTGLEEVERIEREMQQIVKELGLQMTLQDFKKKLKTEKKNFYNSAQEVLDTASTLIYKRILPTLSKIFHNITKSALKITKSPPNFPPAIYLGGTEDGTRPGELFVNNHDYATLPRHLMLSLVLHEAYPGHHLQSSYMLQKKDMPKFRTVIEDRKLSQAPSLFSMNTAFAEGWGMYCETLGHELGLYEDPMDRYGQLSGEIFRACRLVVDTGMHAMGWSMEKAIAYLLEHSDFDQEFIAREVSRYVTWPGQAVSYKIGQMEILRQRKRAEHALGDKFDIRQFHQVVLMAAGPLNILEQQVDKFIKDFQ